VLREQLRDERFQAGDILIVYSRWADLQRLEASAASWRSRATRGSSRASTAAAGAVLLRARARPGDLHRPAAVPGADDGRDRHGRELGVLSMDEAYRAVSWKTVFLLAALLPLGLAVERTGTAAWIAQRTLLLFGDPRPS
jgi:di/tricarboxylate transporter